MKKTLLAVTLAALTSGAATTALAADPKAPEPEIEISGNIALTTDYRFRGISQSNLGPAIQGGLDLAHKSGAYIGTWGSSVSNWTNPGGSGMELDIYGGYATELPTGVGIDVGVIRYIYPGNENQFVSGSSGKSADSTEAYVGVSFGPVSYKYSRMLSENWFTYQAKKGSYYHDFGFETALNDQVTLSAHYGIQKVKGNTGGLTDFSDYKIGVAIALADEYSVGIDYVATGKLTDAEKSGFFMGGTNSTEKLYKSGLVLSLSKTF